MLDCPACEMKNSDWSGTDCPQCKMPQTPQELFPVIDKLITEHKERGGKMSRHLAQLKIGRYLAQAKGAPPVANDYHALLNDENIIRGILARPLPTPSEQANNLIRLLADSEEQFHGQRIKFYECGHKIGSLTLWRFNSVVNDVQARNLISLSDSIRGHNAIRGVNGILTMQGWRYYNGLPKDTTSSKKGFMAMKFKNAPLRQILDAHFKPAAKQAGFELTTLDDQPVAGLIDDHMLVAIRTSAFIVADLSDKNPGAYFEAGFALGLDKPVIFTCEHKKWKRNKTHFDTNHHRTIPWDSEKPEEAAKDLKATIRATLPDKAKMSDEEE